MSDDELRGLLAATAAEAARRGIGGGFADHAAKVFSGERRLGAHEDPDPVEARERRARDGRDAESLAEIARREADGPRYGANRAVVAAPAQIARRESGVKTPAEVARELDRLAESSGNAAFRRAARALRQQDLAGRPAINDALAIEEALRLFRNGEARTMNAAFRQVARAIEGFSEPRSVVERLRRKWRAKKESAK